MTADEQLLLVEIVYGLAVSPNDNTGDLAGGTSLPSDQNISPATGKEASTLDSVSAEPREAAGSAKPDIVADTTALDIESGTYMFNSLVLFHNRFARSFPGVRDVTWFDDEKNIGMRLERLLEEPLTSPQGRTPIWWWRGGNYHIESFRRLSDGTYLMNFEELDIRRIAAIPGKNYQWSFVYVETNGMPPTGLYKSSNEDVLRRIDRWGYDSEEYGLFRGSIPIARGEYDDGAAMIEGEIVDTIGQAALRVRYTTPYNFIIAPHGSPINISNFDRTLTEILNAYLKNDGDINLATLSALVDALPLRHHE